VTVVRVTLVARWRAVTVTPGRIPPLESATRPTMSAVPCAAAGVARAHTEITMPRRSRILFTMTTSQSSGLLKLCWSHNRCLLRMKSMGFRGAHNLQQLLGSPPSEYELQRHSHDSWVRPIQDPAKATVARPG